jgi:hypothetical protein
MSLKFRMAGERACGMGSGFNSQDGEFEFFEVVFLSGPVSASMTSIPTPKFWT